MSGDLDAQATPLFFLAKVFDDNGSSLPSLQHALKRLEQIVRTR